MLPSPEAASRETALSATKKKWFSWWPNSPLTSTGWFWSPTLCSPTAPLRVGSLRDRGDDQLVHDALLGLVSMNTE
jgi:hypothetical protein